MDNKQLKKSQKTEKNKRKLPSKKKKKNMPPPGLGKGGGGWGLDAWQPKREKNGLWGYLPTNGGAKKKRWVKLKKKDGVPKGQSWKVAGPQNLPQKRKDQKR